MTLNSPQFLHIPSQRFYNAHLETSILRLKKLIWLTFCVAEGQGFCRSEAPGSCSLSPIASMTVANAMVREILRFLVGLLRFFATRTGPSRFLVSCPKNALFGTSTRANNAQQATTSTPSFLHLCPPVSRQLLSRNVTHSVCTSAR